MKQYLGNYLGLVVGDQDPDQRGRVQVFIPHIMAALYEGWNQDGRDISFNVTGDNIPTGLTKPIIDKLQKILPWAECAAPIFGAGPAGKYDPNTGNLRSDWHNVGSGSKDGLIPNNLGSILTVDPTVGYLDQNTLNFLDQKSAEISGFSNAQPRCLHYTYNILLNQLGQRSGDTASGVENAKDAGPLLRSKGLIPYPINDPKEAPPGSYIIGQDTNDPGYAGHIAYKNTNGQYNYGAGFKDTYGSSRSGSPSMKYVAYVFDENTAKAINPNVAYNVNNGLKVYPSTGNSTNPSADKPLRADINTKTDPSQETGQVQDSGLTVTQQVNTGANVSPGNLSAPIPDSNGYVDRAKLQAYIQQQVANSPLNGYKPKDGSYYGVDGTPSSWANYLTELSIRETNNGGQNPNVFTTGDNGTSKGLFQLSNSNGTSYPQIAGNRQWTDDQIYNVAFNVNAAIGIQTQLIQRDGQIGPLRDENGNIISGRNLGASKYWGPIQRGWSPSQNSNTESAAVPQRIIQHPRQDFTSNYNTNNIPTGMFGSARIGQMVWVFFQEGNPLFPVYFAASYGQSEWANAHQHGSPDPVTAHSALHLDGGFLRSQQVIAGQNGFTDDEFSFEVGGKDGSSLNFSSGTTQLFSKYHFSQHTQGNHNQIIGANSEQRVGGDFNCVVDQDYIITIGNWEQDAIDAATAIQKTIDEAMKAAKDSIES